MLQNIVGLHKRNCLLNDLNKPYNKKIFIFEVALSVNFLSSELPGE